MRHEHQWVKIGESENNIRYSCGICSQIKREKKKWLPDISSNFTFYKKLFESDLGKEKYDECVESLRKANEILGAEYRVKLTGDLWADWELLLKAQDDYRREYTDRWPDEFRF